MDDLRPAGPAEYRWLLAVQERERRLLAQAVHDDIGQYLTGIRTQLLLLRCTAGDGQPALARLERYCQGLAALLRGLLPDVEVNEAGDGEEALQAVQREIPSLVIVDLGLPGISGLELTRRLRQRLPQLRVLFFSLHDELALVRQALDAGARGYVTKRAAPTVLLEAIRRVLAGQLYLEQPLATRLACQSWEEQGGAALRGLTRREFEIFRLLARGLALREVAEHLGVSAKTVSNHVSLLKQKLQVSTQAELVHRAIDSGVLRLGLPLPLAEEARGSLG
ncbi:response regulator [Pseudomonas aeruginosa]